MDRNYLLASCLLLGAGMTVAYSFPSYAQAPPAKEGLSVSQVTIYDGSPDAESTMIIREDLVGIPDIPYILPWLNPLRSLDVAPLSDPPDFISDCEALEVINEIEAPVLFVHGDADRQVPIAHSESMHDARRRAGLESTLWVLPGGEHGFDNYPPEGIFWNRILDFFDLALGGPPPEWELSS